MGAVVFCQPIEMRVARAAGFCMAAANRWNYCPDYEGLDLASCRRAHWGGHAKICFAPMSSPVIVLALFAVIREPDM